MALSEILINKSGKTAGRNSVEVAVLDRQVKSTTALSCKDSKERDNIYGAGESPAGRDEGDYKAEASIILLKEEVNVLQLTPGPEERLTDIEPSDIPVIREYKRLVMKDMIRNVGFTDNGVDIKRGDKSIATQLTLPPSHIDWSVATQFNNRLRDF